MVLAEIFHHRRKWLLYKCGGERGKRRERGEKHRKYLHRYEFTRLIKWGGYSHYLQAHEDILGEKKNDT